MSVDKEKMLISILEESPIYSGLQRDEKRLLIENLVKAYSDLFGKSRQSERAGERRAWFRKKLK